MPDEMVKALSSQIGRVVAFVLTPLLTAVLVPLAVWLQKELGVHLDTVETVGYIVGLAAAITGGAVTWLVGRWKFEQAAALAAAPPREVPPGGTGTPLVR